MPAWTFTLPDNAAVFPGRARFPFAENDGSLRRMSTITAILKADADGTLHLPLPAELRGGKVKVIASVEAADDSVKTPPARLTATPEMIKERMEALAEVRRLNPYRDIIDPVAWQREIREDRPLPGRD